MEKLSETGQALYAEVAGSMTDSSGKEGTDRKRDRSSCS